jgi:amidophosphoribosyltransferase
VFAHELDTQKALTPEAAFKAVEGVNRRARGGYAVITAVLGLGLVAFRDPHGIRPLVLGKRTAAAGDEYIVASESVALDVLGFERMRDVAPGEAVVITARGELFTQMCAQPQQHAPCIFEFVYFARPDSMMDDISVHKARMRMGVKLGEKIQRLRPDHDIDVVIPIPDTSRDSAMEIANVLGLKYREGFVKNRYVGRTFIMPGQGERAKSVRRKLNTIPLEFKDRVVLLVDDSIVRGTTSRQIVQMARDAGARKVYLASAAPPVRFPNVYGIDMPSPEELVAHGRTEEEVQALLGVDWLIYQDLADLEEAVTGPKGKVTGFDSSCFDGDYVTGVEPGYFERIRQLRSDEAKKSRRAAPR